MSERHSISARIPRVTPLAVGLVLVLTLIVAGELVATHSSLILQGDLVPTAVDTVRNLPFVGPDRMAALEDAYYTLQDNWNLFVYDRTHPPVVTAKLSGGTVGQDSPPAGGNPVSMIPAAASTVAPANAPVPASAAAIPTPAWGEFTTAEPALPNPIAPLILSDPLAGEGIWTPIGPQNAGRSRPLLERATFRPDPERPYARADIVWIDLAAAQVDMVAGTAEPRGTGLHGTGLIPLPVQQGGKLIAAWNGGFLTIHGQYGMMVDRKLISQPRDGFAVFAQYQDGTNRIGVWGRDITLTPDLVSFRENGPILIDKGVLNEDGMLAWGKSVGGETHIWRSGIGLTRDGALLYAAGNALSAQALGEALLEAGAVEAMQLDVNAWHVYFFTYAQVPGGLAAAKLNSGMAGSNRTFMVPHDRDFMYLTLKGPVHPSQIPDPLLTP